MGRALKIGANVFSMLSTVSRTSKWCHVAEQHTPEREHTEALLKVAGW